VRPPPRAGSPSLWWLVAATAALGCVPHGAAPLAGPAPAGAAPVDAPGAHQVASAPLGPLLVRKWRLANGLDIITVPDARARSISYVTTFRVGSRDENSAGGQTGLAHLCEHLMFAGTRGGYRTGEFDRRLEAAGGSANAMTSYDFTAYVDDIPPALLADTIRLEADRMVNLDLGDNDVTTERDIVVEERLQSSQDDIDGELEELVWGQAFRTHPYRWPVIGRMADIKTVTKDSVCHFYQAHYRPARAVVVVAGRFDEATALPLLAAAYGTLPASGRDEAEATIAPERAPEREVRAAIERPVPAERFMIGYPAPGLADADRPAYELLDELLAGGPSARLPRSLMVDRELASSVEAEVSQTRDPGLWTIVVQAMKGSRAAAAEQVIQQEIARLIAQPVSIAELDGARNRLATAFWRELSSSQGRADALGRYDVITGDFRVLLERGQAYARVTPDDVSRVARLYLGPGARSVVVARPKGATP